MAESPPGNAAEGSGRWVALALVLVAAAALVPWFPGARAGWISEDTAAVAYALEEPVLADWDGTQYDLRTVRFWRPLVTTSLAVQARVHGLRPARFRALNALAHAAAAGLVLLLARRTGARPLGALAAGLAAALFPHAGGTLVWVVGRVDSLMVPFVVGAVLAALSGRPLVAAIAAFLGCATKETAFVAPALVALAAFGRGDAPRAALRTALPVLAAVAVAFVWRRLAIGAWVGGYAAPAEPLGAGAVVDCAVALARAVWPTALAGLAIAVAAHVAGVAAWRGWLAGIGWTLAAAAPLVHVLATGDVAPEHLRTLQLADVGLCLAAGTVLGPGAARVRSALVAAVVAVAALVGWRYLSSADDANRWSDAAALADHIEAYAREHGGASDGRSPLLLRDVPRVSEGAYALQHGLADRFRTPIADSGAPIWPHRPLFAAPRLVRPALGRELGSVVEPFLDGRGARAATAPGRIQMARSGVERVVVDAAAWLAIASGERPDDSPRLVPHLPPGTASVEALLYTDVGYLPALVDEALADGALSLVEIVLAGEPIALHAALAQSADFGGTSAWIELRAHDAAGALLATSDWIVELTFDRALRDALLPR